MRCNETHEQIDKNKTDNWIFWFDFVLLKMKTFQIKLEIRNAQFSEL